MKIFHFAITASLLASLFTTNVAQSQKRLVSGIVKSFEESFPLEGVAVTVKGTNNASGTQADGAYYINVTEKDSVLVFSFPGYQPQEIKITKDNEYNVVLKAANGSTGINSHNPSEAVLTRCSIRHNKRPAFHFYQHILTNTQIIN